MGGSCVAVPARGARGRAARIAAARAGHLPGQRRRSLAGVDGGHGQAAWRAHPAAGAAERDGRGRSPAGRRGGRGPGTGAVRACPLGGNALYVTTLARVLAAQPGAAADADAVARIAAGSAEVSHLVASLLRDLDDGASALLAAASVLGAEFDSGLAAAIAGTSQDAAGALAGAQTRGLVTRSPG